MNEIDIRNYAFDIAKKNNIKLDNIALSTDIKAINGYASDNKIYYSKLFLSYIDNEKEDYKALLDKLIGHELTHIKYNDKFPAQDNFIKMIFPNDTIKLINIIQELRADIEGKALIKQSVNDLHKAFDIEYKTIRHSLSNDFKKGYPNLEERKYYTKLYDGISKLNKTIIRDICRDYNNKYFNNKVNIDNVLNKFLKEEQLTLK